MFRRNGGTSVIDVMGADRTTARGIVKSEVLLHLTESDHMYVLHTIGLQVSAPMAPQ